jgi:integrase
MGFTQKREGRRGVRYVSTWADDQGRQREKTFARKTDADNWWKDQESAKRRGEYVDTSNKITLTEYADKWLASRPHRNSTAIRDRSLVKVHIAGTPLGARRVTAIRNDEVQDWVTDRARVLAPGTVRLAVAVLSGIFNAAIRSRMISTNPATGLSLPRMAKSRIVPLTTDQVHRLADAIDPRARAMVITQSGIGVRIAELLALRVQDVDFERRSVRIDWQLSQDGQTRLPQLKSDNSHRTVPLPQMVAEELLAHLVQFPPAESGELFSTAQGNLYRQEHYQARIFRKAVAAAGLPEGTTPHGLRHAYASWLLAAGESVFTVAERIGDTPQQVFKTYGHVMPNGEDRTRRAIDDAWDADQTAPERATGK